MSGAIGILGGTFAPIHNGHLRLAMAARDQLGLSEVRLIPAAQPPLRTSPAIAAQRRLRWVQLAIQGEKNLLADGRELNRAGPSYTVDTLTELRAEHPHAPLCLLLGQDALNQLPQWRRWLELPALAHLVYFNRPGVSGALPEPVQRLLQNHRAQRGSDLLRTRSGLWWRCELPPMAVSASDIRRRLAQGHSVHGLVPERVIDDFTTADLEAFTHDEAETLTGP